MITPKRFRSFPCLTAILTALAIGLPTAVAAQGGSAGDVTRDLAWTWTGGPEGGWVQCLVTTPAGTVLAGTENGGLFRSADGGLTWASTESGIAWPCCNYNVSSLACSATTVYAGSWGAGVFRSLDDGQSWGPSGPIPGEPYPVVRSIATCTRGDRVYAAGNFGVAVSHDAGENWTALNAGLPGTWVTGLALRGTTVYAMLDSGVYRLDQGAPAWVPWSDGLVSTIGMQSLHATAGALYLATHEGGVCHLDCGDSTWVYLNNGLWDDNADAVVEVDQQLYAGTMGSGLFRYDESTASWSALAEAWNGDIRSMTRRRLQVLAGTFGAGVLSYDTESNEWTSGCAGMVAPMVTSLAHDGSVVYAGLEGAGVYCSHDQGATWNRSLDGVVSITALDLVTDETAVYASTWNGVMKSTDQGLSWSAAGLQGNGIFSLDYWPPNLYAGSFDGRVWTSSDGGGSWEAVGAGLPSGIVRGVVQQGSVLWAAVNDGGVFTNVIGQSSWSPVNTGLPQLSLNCLCLGGADLYVGTENSGVWRLDPVALAWEAAGLQDRTIFCLTDTGSMMMAGSWGELFTTVDGGQTWTTETEGLKDWLPVRAIVSGGGQLYAGLGGGGVWRAAGAAGVEIPDSPRIPEAFLGVRPNPLGPAGRVVFRLPQSSRVDLAVFDASGRRVATLAAGELPAGEHERAWDGRLDDGSIAAAGVYLVRMESNGAELTTKAIRIY